MGFVRRAGLAAAIAAAPLGLAYRFALAYRARAGYPRQNPPQITPADLGLPFETTTVRSGDVDLPAWFIPARGGQPGPGVALVHGWESARDRTLPNALFLHAAGFHCLAIDVRGHGANPAEALPLSAGEFGLDATAAFEALVARPEVTVGAVMGHSMGAIGAILAGAADPRVAAVVATSVARRSIPAHAPDVPPGSPADPGPHRLSPGLADDAGLPLAARPHGRRDQRDQGDRAVPRSDPARPRGRGPGRAVRSHGPPCRRPRASSRGTGDAPVETLAIVGGQHSWLYEEPAYRAAVARFLTTALGGPLDPDEAARLAAATQAERIPDAEARFAAVDATPGGFRTLAQVAMPGATRVPAPDVAGNREPGVPPAAEEPGLG